MERGCSVTTASPTGWEEGFLSFQTRNQFNSELTHSCGSSSLTLLLPYLIWLFCSLSSKSFFLLCPLVKEFMILQGKDLYVSNSSSFLVLIIHLLVLMIFEIRAILISGKIFEKQLVWLTFYESWRRKEWIVSLAYVRVLKISGVFLSSVLMPEYTIQVLFF